MTQTTERVTERRFPLVYNFQDLIAGNGFIASVAARGRALLKETTAGCDLVGVEANGLAAQGPSREVVMREFRLRFRNTLVQFALLSSSFEEFDSEVHNYFTNLHPTVLAQWDADHLELRQHNLPQEGLHVVRFDPAYIGLDVENLAASDLRPELNPNEEFARAA